MMQRGYLVFVLLFVSRTQPGLTRCHDDCTCLYRRGSTIVTCRNKRRSYKSPVEDLPPTTTVLRLHQYHDLKIPYQLLQTFRLQALSIRSADLRNIPLLPQTLTVLDLEKNRLNFSVLVLIASRNLSSLHSLYLQDNKIIVPNINEPIFKGIPYLMKIVFSHNIVSRISERMLESLPLLRELRMTHCQIENIHPRAFKDLKALSKLDLSNNRLKKLTKTLFSFNENMRSLSVANNQLTSFPVITGPFSMEALDLSYNDVSDLGNLSMSTIKSVIFLSLQGNKISQFPTELLTKIQVIVMLDLSVNYIPAIEEKILKRSFTLSVINLSNNRIQNLTNTTFQGFRNLKRLYLNGNQLSAIPYGAFRGMRLSTLFMHENKLTTIGRVFAGVKKLSLVTLYDNKLRLFSKTDLDDLPHGTRLFISCNAAKLFDIDVSSRLFLSCVSTDRIEFEDVDFSAALNLVHSGYECPLIQEPVTQFMKLQSCRSCRPGHYNRGERRCNRCPKGGYYQDQTAQSNCKKCNNGQYVKHEGGTSMYHCQTCPSGTNPHLFADTRACYCLPGHARRDRFGRCNECTEEGVTCFNGTKHLAPGYWWKWHSIDDAKKYICFQQNLQVNGEGYDVDCNTFHKPLPKIYRCPFKAACLGGMQATCHTNYTGPLCAACSPGYYPTMLGCLSCPSKFIIVLQILTIGFLMLICILVLCYTSQIWLPRKLHQPERTLSDAIASVTKIVLTYYQLVAVIVRLLYDLQWPKLIVQISSVLYHYALLLFSIPSLKCIHPSLQFNAYDEMILVVTIVLLPPILLFLIKRLHFYLAMRYRQLSDPDMRKDKLAKAYWTSLLVIYFVLYPGICQRIFQIMPFNCRKICLDRAAHICNSYLRVDFTARCPESQPGNWVFVYIGYAALIIPPVFPACLLVLMWKGKREQETQTQFSQQTSFAAAITRFCCENYKAKYWYWEILELSRKLLFAVGFAFFGLDSITKLAYLIIISAICTVVYAYVKPIQHKYEHYLQLFSLSGLFLNLCLCVLLSTSSSRNYFNSLFSNQGIGLTIVFLIINLLPIVAVFGISFVSAIRAVGQVAHRF